MNSDNKCSYLDYLEPVQTSQKTRSKDRNDVKFSANVGNTAMFLSYVPCLRYEEGTGSHTDCQHAGRKVERIQKSWSQAQAISLFGHRIISAD